MLIAIILKYPQQTEIPAWALTGVQRIPEKTG